MKYTRFVFLGFICMGCNNTNQFKDAKELIGADTPLSEFKLSERTIEYDFGNMKVIKSDHKLFDSALVINTTKMTIQDWNVLVTCPVKDSLLKGDMVYVEFYARTVIPKQGTDIGQVTFRYHSLVFPVQPDANWKRYASYAVMEENIPPSDLWIHCSFEPQCIALGGIKIYKFDAGTEIKTPGELTPLYERGNNWEKAADQRIDSLRKGDVEFILKNDQGIPVKDCAYQIEMTRHDFKFGTAVAVDLISDTTDDGKRYREVLQQDFNHIVFENSLKWHSWKNPVVPEKVFNALGWFDEQGITSRGHCLVWPWFDFQWKLKEVNFDTAALKDAVLDHLTEKATALEGRLVDWDILNEPFVIRDTNGIWLYEDIMDIVGKETVFEWFRAAREIDSQPRLFINDYDIVSDGASFEKHKDDLESFISMLIEHNIPLDGIGFQGHFEGLLTPPEQVYKVIDRFAKFDLPILITEFDAEVSGGHGDVQYRFICDFLKICFSHPNTDGFLNWGFWAGRHWRPRTAFYDKNWNITPAGKAWKDMVYKEWWTRYQGRTDQSGKVEFTGFYGDYLISWSVDNQSYKKEFSFTKHGLQFKN